LIIILYFIELIYFNVIYYISITELLLYYFN